ncbi:MAG: hypothetical protein ACK6D6_18195 [Planctomyces sp.]
MKSLSVVCLCALAGIVIPIGSVSGEEPTTHSVGRSVRTVNRSAWRTASRISTTSGHSDSGVRKPIIEADVADSPVTKVAWEQKASSGTSAASARDFAGPNTATRHLPTPQIASGFSGSSAGGRKMPVPAAGEKLHPEVLGELSKPSAGSVAVQVSETYLDELQRLRDEPRPWLGLRGAASPKGRPGDVGPLWLQELTQLDALRHPTLARMQSVQQSTNEALARPDVATDAKVSIDSLFRPLSSVQLASKAEGREGESTSLSLQALIDGKRASANAADYLLPARPGSGPAPGTMRLAVRESYVLYHNPLYFEDADLERCGASSGWLTPAASVAQFVVDAALLPYRMAVDPPTSKVRDLGDCRTGSEYSADTNGLPVSLRGLAAEAGVITALIFIIP